MASTMTNILGSNLNNRRCFLSGDRSAGAKRILITGVSAGLGIETARLTSRPRLADVIGAARRVLAKSGKNAHRTGAQGTATVGGRQLRTGRARSGQPLRNVACLRRWTAGERRIPRRDLSLTAGVELWATPFGHTADGFETQFRHQSPGSLCLG